MSKPAQEYLHSRSLDSSKIEVGYNTGQFHHGTRKDEGLIQQCLQYGLLSEHDRLSRTGETCYKPFAKFCIVFALRNKANQVTGLYFRSTVNDQEQKHFYLKDLTTGSIYIKSTYKTASRTLQLKAAQILLFHQYITEIRTKLLNGNESNALLIGIRGGAMSGEDITKHVKRSFKQLYPNRKVNAQTIRQSVITNLLKQGHDLSLVQGFAGHKYPSTTERYKQSEIETLKAAVNKYHPFG